MREQVGLRHKRSGAFETTTYEDADLSDHEQQNRFWIRGDYDTKDPVP